MTAGGLGVVVVIVILALIFGGNKDSSSSSSRRTADEVVNSDNGREKNAEKTDERAEQFQNKRNEKEKRPVAKKEDKNTELGPNPRKADAEPKEAPTDEMPIEKTRPGKTDPVKMLTTTPEVTLVGKWLAKWTANGHEFAVEWQLTTSGIGVNYKSQNGNPISHHQFKWSLAADILTTEIGKTLSEFRLTAIEASSFELTAISSGSIGPGQKVIFRKVN